MSSRTGIGPKDLEKLEKKLLNLAANAEHACNENDRGARSLALCFDALVTVLDRQAMPDGTKKISELLKIELDERKIAMEAARKKPPEPTP